TKRRRRTSRGRRPTPLVERLKGWLAVCFTGPHSADVWGLVLVLAGLLAALALYVGTLGPAGDAIDRATGDALGIGRYLLPMALGAGGALLFTGRPREDRTRAGVGLVLVTVASCGLLHVVRGAPGWDADSDRLRRAGGLVGQAAGHPL